MTKEITTEKYIIWQETEMDLPEQAVYMQDYGNFIYLEQEGQAINLNKESIPEFIKVLKKMKDSCKEK